jgi:hypothetical protein
MEVIDIPCGRLGNAMFRYLASTLFCIVYKAVRRTDRYTSNTPHMHVSDELFIDWKNNVEDGFIPPLDNNKLYLFKRYYQSDTIYIKYLSEIKEYIRSHPSEELRTESVTDGETIVYSIQLLEDSTVRKYDTVIHIRLEDFITYGFVIHPMYFKQLIETAGITKACIVVNIITNELEQKYINYLKQYCDITIESNDIITDYHIMRNAKTLVCSNSTISWAAALLSETVTTVYMPNYPATHVHETFRTPIKNTIQYEIKTCTKEELETFLKDY